MRLTTLLLGLLLTGLASATDVVLQTTAGGEVRPLGKSGKVATVYVFLLSECPNANAYAPEINRIAAYCAKKGAAMSVVMVDPNLTAQSAGRHARDYGFKIPVLLDPDQKLARVSGAKISPTAAVYDRSMKLLYSGRIDDLFYAPGRRRAKATTHDLRNAIDSVVAGKPVRTPRTTPIGCILPPPGR